MFIYTCTIGVNGLYCTSDGFLVLQRRAAGLQTGPGNLGASTAGTLRYEDLCTHGAFRTDGLLNGLYRETFEELGISREELIFGERPCTGMGLNLRHGRDPNFYFFGCLSIDHGAISERRWHPKHGGAADAWECDHLVFVPLEAVGEKGILYPPFDQLVGGARHLKGALYALAHNDEFRRLRDEWQNCRRSTG